MKVIIVSGPTATGKTHISIELAKSLSGEIVNFDSLLLYREINIGTAKPTIEEKNSVPHHMIDVATISAPLNASDYAQQALKHIKAIHAKGSHVYLVGGSGFYLQALLKGMFNSATTPKPIQDKSDSLYLQHGIFPFIEILQQQDPISLQRYHENDHYRIRRAVEHFWTNGSPFSQVRELKDSENARQKEKNIHGWEVLHIHLDLPKIEHWEIIRARTEKMIKHGLLDEVKELLSSGYTGEEKPLQSIGYKEVIDLHRGIITNINECQERINISTRQLAKAQRTWFKKIDDKQVFHPLTQFNELVQTVSQFLTK
jgi:tRNA dimethylallyltransferase